MNPKLIFLDIDGTLTPPGTNVPPESAVEAIRKARSNGHKVFLCSGRNLPMLRPLLDRYQFDGAVGGTGSLVLVGDKILYDCPMETEDFKTAMKLLGENHVYRTIESKVGAWCDEGIGKFLMKQNGGNSELIRLRKAVEDNLGMKPIKTYKGEPIYKIVYLCEKAEQLAPARKALENRYHFIIQEEDNKNCLNGEMFSRQYDKGKGIRIAAEAMGFDLSDTIGVGDSMNDIEMIETVGYSVCMGDGSPTLKAKSDYVCPALHQDGLAAAFEKLGLV